MNPEKHDVCPHCGSPDLQNVELLNNYDEVVVVFEECARCLSVLGVVNPPQIKED